MAVKKSKKSKSKSKGKSKSKSNKNKSKSKKSKSCKKGKVLRRSMGGRGKLRCMTPKKSKSAKKTSKKKSTKKSKTSKKKSTKKTSKKSKTSKKKTSKKSKTSKSKTPKSKGSKGSKGSRCKMTERSILKKLDKEETVKGYDKRSMDMMEKLREKYENLEAKYKDYVELLDKSINNSYKELGGPDRDNYIKKTGCGENLNSLTVTKLKSIAKKLGLDYDSDSKKKELVSLIKNSTSSKKDKLVNSAKKSKTPKKTVKKSKKSKTPKKTSKKKKSKTPKKTSKKKTPTPKKKTPLMEEPEGEDEGDEFGSGEVNPSALKGKPDITDEEESM
jgi:hypothetical protein